MHIHDSCRSAIQACLDSKTFAIARLFNNEKTMSIHIHDCYEIYFSIAGAKQFLIDNRVYEVKPGDIFFINQFESHYLSQIDQATHERVVISVHPEYLRQQSTEHTDLNHCFTCRDTAFGHRLSLSELERKRFMYLIHKLSENGDFGQDVMERTLFLELIIFLNRAFQLREQGETQTVPRIPHGKIDEILSYINQHLADDLTLASLAARFNFNSRYLRRIFKSATGTTINRYITAKRISKAKALLVEGCSVAETCTLCGFGDYSNFLKAFTKAVGVSPKKYASYAHTWS